MTEFITSSEHAIVGRSGSPADVLEPGGRVLFDENVDSHKFLRSQIEAGAPDYAHLSIVDVDLKAEKKQQEEFEEKQEEARKIAAKVRDEQLQAAQESAGDTKGIEGEQPPVPQVADVDAPAQDEEAQRLAKESGPGQRATTQEDVVEEDSSPKQGRRSSRRSG